MTPDRISQLRNWYASDTVALDLIALVERMLAAVAVEDRDPLKSRAWHEGARDTRDRIRQAMES